MGSEMCEEDEIIERLREGGSGEVYYDAEFGGSTSSLYWDENQDPGYDVVWLRPQEVAGEPEYFIEASTEACRFVEGALGEGWLLGALAAISGHGEYLVENLFGSEPEDFKDWGVYTCRFYQQGEWVEVVTDTRLPCRVDEANGAPRPAPICGGCANPREQWAGLLVKAYAKLHGCYEALGTGTLREALVDLTGGAAEDVGLDEYRRKSGDASKLFDAVERHCQNGDVLCCTVGGGGTLEAGGGAPPPPEGAETPLGLLQNRAYCVRGCKKVGETRFVALRNPWAGRGFWRGPWSNASTQWEDFPEVLEELQRDPKLAWDRTAEDGALFFMTLEDFVLRFDALHVCRLFPDSKFKQYKAHGVWTGKTAGGPLTDAGRAKLVNKQKNTHLPPETNEKTQTAASAEGETPAAGVSGKKPEGAPENGAQSCLAAGNAPGAPPHAEAPQAEAPKPEAPQASAPEAEAPEASALARALKERRRGLTVLESDDASWFNNPQFRVSATRKTEAYVSLTQGTPRRPAGTPQNEAPTYSQLGFQVLRSKRQADVGRVFSLDRADLVRSVPADPSTAKAVRELGAAKIALEPGYNYSIVVHTSARGREAHFVLRIFAPADLKVQAVPETSSHYVPGAWKCSPENDTAGGPPVAVKVGKQLPALAPRWCLNPQYLIKTEAAPDTLPEAVDLKLVLRRTDASVGPVGAASEDSRSCGEAPEVAEQHHPESTVPGADPVEPVRLGLVVCKQRSEARRDKRAEAKEPRTNALGEPTPVKASTLKKKNRRNHGRHHGAGAVASSDMGLLDPAVGPESPTSPSSAASSRARVPARKVLFDASEWHALSDFADPSLTALSLVVPRNRITAGLVVSPCLSEAGAEGAYVLEVHAAVPLTVDASPETKSKTLVGQWTPDNAGGSHLHQSCASNPKYRLSFLSGVGRAKVDIVLSRPDAAWKKKTDIVGAMCGFYLERARSLLDDADRSHANAGIYHLGKPWNESPFVPLNAVSTPPGFSLECSGAAGTYTITPATYAPGKTGPFFLSVTSDTDFTLVPGPNTSAPP